MSETGHGEEAEFTQDELFLTAYIDTAKLGAANQAKIVEGISAATEASLERAKEARQAVELAELEGLSPQERLKVRAQWILDRVKANDKSRMVDSRARLNETEEVLVSTLTDAEIARLQAEADEAAATEEERTRQAQAKLDKDARVVAAREKADGLRADMGWKQRGPIKFEGATGVQGEQEEDKNV